mgnify:CR=1 FL=1|jgi:hypothetical protein
MKNAMINKTHIEGVLYQHDLELKVTGETSKNPGTEYIAGSVEIATDDAGVNIVPVHFTYVTATTSKGKANASFNTLKDIVDGKLGTIMKDGADKAAKLRIDSAIGLNEFYSERNGQEELVSVKRNEGGFIHVVSSVNEDEKTRNTFEVDMIITNVSRIEANEERQTPEKVIVRGVTFNFRNDILPIELSVTNPNAMDYFEGLGASGKEPVFTRVRGRQVSETIVRTIEEESAFGEASVREVKSTRKDFVITWAQKEPYIWDDESTITAAELSELVAKRETDLAAMKARSDEYKASKGASKATSAPKAGAFDF